MHRSLPASLSNVTEPLRGFAMPAPVPLRDFDAALLRKLARGSRDPDQTRRLVALAEIYESGCARTRRGSAVSGCRLCAIGCFAATPGSDGLLNDKAPGTPTIGKMSKFKS
jgi:hypothetical protein